MDKEIVDLNSLSVFKYSGDSRFESDISHCLQSDGIEFGDIDRSLEGIPRIFHPGLRLPPRFRFIYITVESDGSDIVPYLRRAEIPSHVMLVIRTGWSSKLKFSELFIGEIRRYPHISMERWDADDLLRFFRDPPPPTLESLWINAYAMDGDRSRYGEEDLMKLLIPYIPQLRKLTLVDFWPGFGNYSKFAAAVSTSRKMEVCRFVGPITRQNHPITFVPHIPDTLRVLDIANFSIGIDTIHLISSPIEVLKIIIDERVDFGEGVLALRKMIDRIRGTIRYLEMHAASPIISSAITLPLPRTLEILRVPRWDPDTWDEIAKVIFHPSCNLRTIQVGLIAEGGLEAPEDFGMRIRGQTRITDFTSPTDYLRPPLSGEVFAVMQTLLSMSYFPRLQPADVPNGFPWHDMVRFFIVDTLGWRLPHQIRMLHTSFGV